MDWPISPRMFNAVSRISYVVMFAMVPSIVAAQPDSAPYVHNMAVTDQDSNGIHDLVVVEMSDGRKFLAFDVDENGIIEQIDQYDFDGNVVESDVVIEDNEYGPTWWQELEWHLMLKNQKVPFNSDGHITNIVSDWSSRASIYGPKLYYQNGIDTSPQEAKEVGQDIAAFSFSNVAVVYNETNGKFKDVVESIFIPESSPLIESCAWSLALDLMNDREIRFFAHSQGAAFIEATLPRIAEILDLNRVLRSRLKNLTIITLGGYSPTADGWWDQVNVIAINNDDIVPALHGWIDDIGVILNFYDVSNHGIVNYYPMINAFAHPDHDISRYYGLSINAAHWEQIVYSYELEDSMCEDED